VRRDVSFDAGRCGERALAETVAIEWNAELRRRLLSGEISVTISFAPNQRTTDKT